MKDIWYGVMTSILGQDLQKGIFVWEQGVSSPNWNLEQKSGYIWKKKNILFCTVTVKIAFILNVEHIESL